MSLFWHPLVQICGINDYDADTCRGDSGGPMTIQPFNYIAYQIGVVSYGYDKPCGRKE